MKTYKTTLVLSLIAAISLLTFGQASADRYAKKFNVNYDLVVQHAYELECIAHDLKGCFRDQFRSSPLYGKLISRTNKIKNQAHRLHRFGTSHGKCNWNDEISRLNELVYELKSYLDESIHRNRYDRSVHSTAFRTVKSLLKKAEYSAAALQHAIQYSPRPVHRAPVNHDPIYEPAPSYAPATIETGYRTSQGFYTRGQGRNSNPIRTQRSKYQPSGITLNVGGLKLKLVN